MLVLAFAGVVVVGFLIGFFSFRVKSRWCPRCGSSTTDCYTPGAHHPTAPPALASTAPAARSHG